MEKLIVALKILKKKCLASKDGTRQFGATEKFNGGSRLPNKKRMMWPGICCPADAYFHKGREEAKMLKKNISWFY